MPDNPIDARRKKNLIAVLAARLARARGDLTDAEFGELLANMAKTAERFAEIDAKPGARRPDMSEEEIRQLLSIPPR